MGRDRRARSPRPVPGVSWGCTWCGVSFATVDDLTTHAAVVHRVQVDTSYKVETAGVGSGCGWAGPRSAAAKVAAALLVIRDTLVCRLRPAVALELVGALVGAVGA